MTERGDRVTRLPDGAVDRGRIPGRSEKSKSTERRLRFPSDAEMLVWQHLRDRSLHRYLFRREVEILGWYVDFYCSAARLVVEVDGRTHRARRAEDNRRDEVMRANYYRVLRLPARLVFEDLREAIQRIERAVDTPWARLRRDRQMRVARKQADHTSDEAPPEMIITPERASRQPARPTKRPFVCPQCSKRFVTRVDVRWIECVRCCVEAKPACRTCGKVGTVHPPSWRCQECHIARELAVESAGPGGDRSQAAPPQARRGKRWTGR
jgi:very-short-patch-repair endonuclease